MAPFAPKSESLRGLNSKVSHPEQILGSSRKPDQPRGPGHKSSPLTQKQGSPPAVSGLLLGGFAEPLDTILPSSRTSFFILQKTTTKLEDWGPFSRFPQRPSSHSAFPRQFWFLVFATPPQHPSLGSFQFMIPGSRSHLYLLSACCCSFLKNENDSHGDWHNSQRWGNSTPGLTCCLVLPFQSKCICKYFLV